MIKDAGRTNMAGLSCGKSLLCTIAITHHMGSDLGCNVGHSITSLSCQRYGDVLGTFEAPVLNTFGSYYQVFKVD